ncbi:MAG: elongation factor G [Armatimonadetes bacterium]|nr:elongation factor G [Armatimonadota bacterium]
MKAHSINAIRNVALVGHGGTGKSSLAESMLYVSGAIGRMGRVDDGSSTSDFDADEIQRKMSINASVLPCEWKNTKINLIDTPGYPDFVGDVISSLRAVEAALLVVDGTGIIDVGTETAWDLANEAGITKLFFVNKLEKENSDFYRTLEALREKFGTSVAPLQLPIGAEDKFTGVVDLLTHKAYKWENGKVAPSEIPGDMADQIASMREALIESVAEMDDALMEKYFDQGTLDDAEIAKGLEIGVRSGKVVPVLCGSAMKMVGVDTLLDFVAASVPSPASLPPAKGKSPAGAEETRGPSDAFCALVFKTMADPYVGKLTYFRVFSGSIKSDSHIHNANKDREERVGQVYFLLGKNQEATSEVGAGDIGAVAKLQETGTGDTLCDKSKPIALEPIAFPDPVYSLAVKAKTKADEDKLGPALQKLSEEDPTFRTHRDSDTNQTVMAGLGDTHLDIVVERLKRKFGVEVDTETPKIAYRETITNTADAQGRHKKQTGGRGQFGDCWVRLEPQPRGAGYEYVDAIVGGAIPRQWIPSVDKGIREALGQGIQAGYPVVDVKATCHDGSFHTVDSSDMAFQLAGKLAFRAAAEKANPVLLEPVLDVEVIVPEEFMGDVIGDLNSKRGRVAGMEPIGAGRQKIKAQVPMAEMLRYSIDLRSIARGRGRFSAKFSHYEEVPHQAAQAVIAEAAKMKKEES